MNNAFLLVFTLKCECFCLSWRIPVLTDYWFQGAIKRLGTGSKAGKRLRSFQATCAFFSTFSEAQEHTFNLTWFLMGPIHINAAVLFEELQGLFFMQKGAFFGPLTSMKCIRSTWKTHIHECLVGLCIVQQVSSWTYLRQIWWKLTWGSKRASTLPNI